MRLYENRVIDDDFHESLLKTDMWSRVNKKRLIGQIFLDAWLAQDEYNVSVYEFDVREVVECFVRENITGWGVLSRGAAVKKAHVIIRDLKAMIEHIEAVLPKKHKLYGGGLKMQKAMIEENFTHHAPKEGQEEVYKSIRDTAKHFANLIDDSMPDSREKSLAVTKLEEAVFWANAGISRDPVR